MASAGASVGSAVAALVGEDSLAEASGGPASAFPALPDEHPASRTASRTAVVVMVPP
jgi:hypothetical protein